MGEALTALISGMMALGGVALGDRLRHRARQEEREREAKREAARTLGRVIAILRESNPNRLFSAAGPRVISEERHDRLLADWQPLREDVELIAIHHEAEAVRELAGTLAEDVADYLDLAWWVLREIHDKGEPDWADFMERAESYHRKALETSMKSAQAVRP